MPQSSNVIMKPRCIASANGTEKRLNESWTQVTLITLVTAQRVTSCGVIPVAVMWSSSEP